jgi:hypothetical protein
MDGTPGVSQVGLLYISHFVLCVGLAYDFPVPHSPWRQLHLQVLYQGRVWLLLVPLSRQSTMMPYEDHS